MSTLLWMMIMIMWNPINFLPNLCRDKQFWISLHPCYIFSKGPWDLALVVDTRVPLETHQIIKCHRRDMLMSLFDQQLSSSIPSSFLVKALTQCHSYLGYPSFRLPVCPIGVPKALKAKIPETNHGANEIIHNYTQKPFYQANCGWYRLSQSAQLLWQQHSPPQGSRELLYRKDQGSCCTF